MPQLHAMQVHASHYLALGAAGALLQHLGSVEAGGMVLTSGALQVHLEVTAHHMRLDAGAKPNVH